MSRDTMTPSMHISSVRRIRPTVACLLLAATLLSTFAMAQGSYPSKPITVIVPFPAGGSTDSAGRLLLNAMSKALGQSIVVENVGGC